MGSKQETLLRLLSSFGKVASQRVLPYPRPSDLVNSPLHNEIVRVYRQLGGIGLEVPCNLRAWDLEVDEVAVELDEQLHFNRYRMMTLKSPVYRELEHFPHSEYVAHCESYEVACWRAGKYGGKWTNSSCESQFGAGNSPGVLEGNGAPRWKQRAFYDFIKDLSPILIGQPVVRLSIWDRLHVNGCEMTMDGALQRGNSSAAAEIMALLKSRI